MFHKNKTGLKGGRLNQKINRKKREDQRNQTSDDASSGNCRFNYRYDKEIPISTRDCITTAVILTSLAFFYGANALEKPIRPSNGLGHGTKNDEHNGYVSSFGDMHVAANNHSASEIEGGIEYAVNRVENKIREPHQGQAFLSRSNSGQSKKIVNNCVEDKMGDCAERFSSIICDRISFSKKLKISGIDSKKLLLFKKQVCKVFTDIYINQSALHCKLSDILKNPRFKIVIVSENEFDRGSYAYYDAVRNEIKIPNSYKTIFRLKTSAIHEIHHAWLKMQNDVHGRHLFHSNILPYGNNSADRVAQTKFAELLRRGRLNIDDYLQLLNKPMISLTREEQKKYENFCKACEKCEPAIYDVSLSRADINSLFNNKIIDKKFYLIKRFSVHSERGVTAYVHELFEDHGQWHGKSSMLKNFSNNLTPGERAIAFLKDLKEILLICDQAYTNNPPLKLAEEDAGLHGGAEDHLEALEILFPGLQKHHHERSDDNYQACVKLRK